MLGSWSQGYIDGLKENYQTKVCFVWFLSSKMKIFWIWINKYMNVKKKKYIKRHLLCLALLRTNTDEFHTYKFAI